MGGACRPSHGQSGYAGRGNTGVLLFVVRPPPTAPAGVQGRARVGGVVRADTRRPEPTGRRREVREVGRGPPVRVEVRPLP